MLAHKVNDSLVILSADSCKPLIDSHQRFMEAKPSDNLSEIIAKSKTGTTILLNDGVYRVATTLVFLHSEVTLRSKSGRSDAVILDGNRGLLPLNPNKFCSEIIQIRSTGIVIADLTLRYARDHAIHIFPSDTGFIQSVLLHNLRVYDTGEHLIKVNSNGRMPPAWVDGGILECSTLEFIDNSVMEKQKQGFYTGGLDVHGGQDWIVRHNIFRNIQRDGQAMDHAVLFWKKSRGTLIENNRFENVYRAIGFGIETVQNGPERIYPDGAGQKPFLEHIDGIIRNNTITNSRAVNLESGISLWNVIGTEVYRNTVLSENSPFSSIEYRFPNTRIKLGENRVSHKILSRNGAKATTLNIPP